jgi:hypothetical protein
MPSGSSLEETARVFAADLADTVSRFLGRECSFTTTATPNGRFAVTDEGDDGIPLYINGEPLLVLSVDIRCHWDSRETYLAVEQSSFKVFAGSQSGEPLFRYEYLRDPNNGDIPCAHLQIGAHRDEFTHALGYGGSSRRSKKRADIPPGKAPKIVDVHFPLGGPRFRPCLVASRTLSRASSTDWGRPVSETTAPWTA